MCGPTCAGAPSTGTLSALPRRLGLRRLSSLALSDAAARTPGGCASPGGAATPLACNGGGAGLFWKRHARQGSDAMSVDDADAELESLRSGSPGGFRRLSVSSPVPTSPLSDFGAAPACLLRVSGSVPLSLTVELSTRPPYATWTGSNS